MSQHEEIDEITSEYPDQDHHHSHHQDRTSVNSSSSDGVVLSSPQFARNPLNNSRSNHNKTSAPSSSSFSSSTSKSLLPSSLPSNKKRLRLKKSSSYGGLFSSETLESLLVFVILNLTLMLAIVASDAMQGMAYLLLGNAVVLRTLQLRAFRVKEAKMALENVSEELKNVSSDLLIANQQLLVNQNEGQPSAVGQGAGGVLSPQQVALSAAENVASVESKPIAGSTYPQIPSSSLSLQSNKSSSALPSPSLPPSSVQHCWSKCDASAFQVRTGPEYARYKRKAPSAPAIYEPFAVDVFW